MMNDTVKVLLASALLVAAAPAAAEEYASRHHRYAVETVADGLGHPWGLAFLPDGRMLVTERLGRIRLVLPDGTKSTPLAGAPETRETGQGGMLDIALDPGFDRNRRVYVTFSEFDGSRSGTALAAMRLVEEGGAARFEGLQVIFRLNQKTRAGRHFGSRVVPAPDGSLFVTVGDRGKRDRAQDPGDHAGSVIRVLPDGSVPGDNPRPDGWAPETWSIGHRNPQGAAINPETGRLWTIAHGARGGDEINIPLAGRNYGWPVISYGRHYSGLKIGEGTEKDGMEQPIHYWDPSIAPSGAVFYTGDAFPEWKGNLFVGALKFRMLVRIELDGEKVTYQENLLKPMGARIRQVRQGPDGLLYVLTDDDNGRIVRIRPAG